MEENQSLTAETTVNIEDITTGSSYAILLEKLVMPIFCLTTAPTAVPRFTADRSITVNGNFKQVA